MNSRTIVCWLPLLLALAACSGKEAAEAAKREADKAHKSSVMTVALEALKAGGVDEASARLALTLILERKVPRVSVSF